MLLLDRLLFLLSTGAPDSADARLTSFLLNHLWDVRRMTVRDVAAGCGVSPASVVRFAAKLGYADFAALRTALTIPCLRMEQSTPQSTPLLTIQARKRQMFDAVGQLDAAPLLQLGEALRRAHTVLHDLEPTPQARALQRKLLVSGKQVVYTAAPAAALATLGADDAALLLVGSAERWPPVRDALAGCHAGTTAGLLRVPAPDAPAHLTHCFSFHTNEPDLEELHLEAFLFLLTQSI